jgi:hypothetical protein
VKTLALPIPWSGLSADDQVLPQGVHPGGTPFGRPVGVRQMVRLEARTLCDRQWPASCLRDHRTTGFHRSAPCLPTAVLSDSMTCVSRNGR